MKRFFTKPVTFEKLEFWLASGIYAFALFYIAMILYNSTNYAEYTPNRYDLTSSGLHYSYINNFFLPVALICTSYYACYSFLNFYVIRNLVANKNIALNIVAIIIALVLLIAALTISDRHYYANIFARSTSWGQTYQDMLKKNATLVFILSLVFAFYTLIKYALHALAKNLNNSHFELSPIARDSVISFSVWIIVLIILNSRGMPNGGRVCWVLVFMFSILLYLISFYKVIPYVKKKGLGFKGFAGRFIMLFLIPVLQVFLISVFMFESENLFFSLLLFNLVVQILIVMPGTWVIYNYRHDATEITGLKTALGSSSAKLDQLRSQINPHFLFNSLNTLYGTALQENADRTAEGIQKLGDMMRLMLHENMQDTILLINEVNYLQNYIMLQKLRTQTSPDIVIQTDIVEPQAEIHIAPMLLIPFIENAFKHGISLREPSFIKISLHVADNILYFDVQNSVHARSEYDPEKYSTGIGLENVEERLKLVYPHKYELSIHQSAKEFFVHLTLNLL